MLGRPGGSKSAKCAFGFILSGFDVFLDTIVAADEATEVGKVFDTHSSVSLLMVTWCVLCT